MWTATKLSEDAASKMQVNAGLLLNTFDISNPVEPLDKDIICETTGDYSISCVPTTEDFFEDVNNAPNNTKEGKRITGWECSLGVTALSVTEEMLKLSLGASDVNEDGGITPREQYIAEDFKSVYWIGDMIEEDKLFVVVMDDTVSTGVLSFCATDNGKGKLSRTLVPHTSTATPKKVPMAFYLLTEVEA
jgi:hypothetical protein